MVTSPNPNRTGSFGGSTSGPASPSMDEYAYALQFRDVIQTMVRDEVERMRPRIQYGTVTSINSFSCAVRYPGETNSILVNMGAIQPTAIGQTVRVEGVPGDRFITDVIGGFKLEPMPTNPATRWPTDPWPYELPYEDPWPPPAPPVTPYAQACGLVDFPIVEAGTHCDIYTYFPSVFNVAPIVLTGNSGSGRNSPLARDVSTSGFTFQMDNQTALGSQAGPGYWFAIQMYYDPAAGGITQA